MSERDRYDVWQFDVLGGTLTVARENERLVMFTHDSDESLESDAFERRPPPGVPIELTRAQLALIVEVLRTLTGESPAQPNDGK